MPGYFYGNRREKATILSEFCATCGYNRKYAIGLLAAIDAPPVHQSAEKRGRKPRYQDEPYLKAVRRLWRDTGYKCGRHIRSLAPEWLPFFELEHGELDA